MKLKKKKKKHEIEIDSNPKSLMSIWNINDPPIDITL